MIRGMAQPLRQQIQNARDKHRSSESGRCRTNSFGDSVGFFKGVDEILEAIQKFFIFAPEETWSGQNFRIEKTTAADSKQTGYPLLCTRRKTNPTSALCQAHASDHSEMIGIKIMARLLTPCGLRVRSAGSASA
jgi:hypothetical protein